MEDKRERGVLIKTPAFCIAKLMEIQIWERKPSIQMGTCYMLSQACGDGEQAVRRKSLYILESDRRGIYANRSDSLERV